MFANAQIESGFKFISFYKHHCYNKRWISTTQLTKICIITPFYSVFKYELTICLTMLVQFRQQMIHHCFVQQSITFVLNALDQERKQGDSLSPYKVLASAWITVQRHTECTKKGVTSNFVNKCDMSDCVLFCCVK